MNEEDLLILTDDEGNQVKTYIVDELVLAGVEYIMTVENIDSDECYILKGNLIDGDDEITYVEVTDENEADIVLDLFNKQLEGIDVIK